MTPDQLNEIEARAKRVNVLVMDSRTISGTQVGALLADVLALVARVRELEEFTRKWVGDLAAADQARDVAIARAKEAEARVKELEADAIGAQLNIEGLMDQRDREEARVAVLREALEDEVERRDHDVSGRGQHLTSCRLCEFEKVLATLDPAATALTDFAREVDEWIGQILDGLPAAVADKLIAWRKLKGETP